MESTVTEFPSPEEVNAVLSTGEADDFGFTDPTDKAVAQKVLPFVVKKVVAQAEAHKAKELAKEVDSLKAANTKLIEEELNKIRKVNTPPTPEELNKLLSQEYAEMEVQVRERGTKSFRVFVLQELTQKVEMKMLKVLQRAIVPRLKELSAVEWTSGTSTAAKIQQVIDMVPEMIDTLADICAIALDPYGEEHVNKEWVQDNLSSSRIINIVLAQVEVGKMRDFFSAVSRAMPG